MRLERHKIRFGHRTQPRRVIRQTAWALLLVTMLATTAVLGGCTGVVGGQNSQPPPLPHLKRIASPGQLVLLRPAAGPPLL